MAAQNEHPFRIDGKIALITGGGSGIGMATAERFSQAGATVLVVDIAGQRAQEVAAGLQNASAHACDITDEAQVRELFTSIDKLDILVNCAGIGLVGGWKRRSWRIGSGCSG